MLSASDKDNFSLYICRISLLITRCASAPKREALKKGIEAAGHIIASIKERSLCGGVHIMAIGKEEVVPKIIKAADPA